MGAQKVDDLDLRRARVVQACNNGCPYQSMIQQAMGTAALLQVICFGRPALLGKIFCFAIEANQFTESRRPDPQEGRCATSSTRDGMRWTPAALKTRARAGGRRSRVVPTPRRLVSSRRKMISAGDGSKRARSPGRARRKPLKPLRGECRVFFRCDRGDDARMFILFYMRGCGCIEHPAFPAPSA